jgi:hypothetical protein
MTGPRAERSSWDYARSRGIAHNMTSRVTIRRGGAELEGRHGRGAEEGDLGPLMIR